jgi:hypothetical protein
MAKAAQDTQPSKPACPECGTEVQSTWRWCLACGFDPDGLRELHERRRPTAEELEAERAAQKAEQRSGAGWTAVVVVVGLLLAGSIYYARSRATTPADAGAPTAVDVPANDINWTLFQSAEGAFSLFVPTTPTAETYDVPFAGTPKTFHNYTAVFGVDSYTVSYIDGDPAEAALPPGERMRTFATNYAAIIGGVPGQVTERTVDGNPVLDFTFDIKGAGLNRSHVVVKGPRTYVISVMGASPKPEDFDRMVTTFKLQ